MSSSPCIDDFIKAWPYFKLITIIYTTFLNFLEI